MTCETQCIREDSGFIFLLICDFRIVVEGKATTFIKPLHAGKGRSVAKAFGMSTDYVKNPDKTDNGEWISSYQCNPSLVDSEFMLSKRQYANHTGKAHSDSDVIAYHLRQSFKPGEANKIGYELAMSLTKGEHAFIVCTHVDKQHIHSHIIFNSTSLDCTKKFRNFWGSSFAVRRISDILCLENGLSVIENPKPSRGSYGQWLGDEKPLSNRKRLEQMIDAVLDAGCEDYKDFLAAMQDAGAEVKTGKHLAFKLPECKRFIRCDSLSGNHSEYAIRQRIRGQNAKQVRSKIEQPTKTIKEFLAEEPKTPRLLIDIQSKLTQANSPGFEQWAKKYNLKEMAKTLVHLKDKGLDDYDRLSEACGDLTEKYNTLSTQTKANKTRMREIAELQKQISTYGKTKNVYAEYRKLPKKKQDAFYEEHRADIMLHEAAKKYFDSLGVQKLPTIQSLKQEYAALSAENKKLYPKQKATRREMIELLTAKSNVERFLNIEPSSKNTEKDMLDERKNKDAER